MIQLGNDLRELQRLLGEGSLQRAYGSIVGYMSRLRAHFAATQGERAVSGLYQGCFDMTPMGPTGGAPRVWQTTRRAAP